MVHKSRHVLAEARGINQATQWAEWQARAREFLYQNGRRPNPGERAAIWDEVRASYGNLLVR